MSERPALSTSIRVHFSSGDFLELRKDEEAPELAAPSAVFRRKDGAVEVTHKKVRGQPWLVIHDDEKDLQGGLPLKLWNHLRDKDVVDFEILDEDGKWRELTDEIWEELLRGALSP